MSGINPISLFTTMAASAAAPIAPAESSSGPLPICDPARNSGGKSKIETAKKAILYIMNNGKGCKCSASNQADYASKIARIAIDTGLKPELIGAIIQRETKFSQNPSYYNNKNGSLLGPMRLSPGVIQEMYEKPENCDSNISKIVGSGKKCKYKTFADALKAKLKNNNIDLGKFGNKFFEFYKQNLKYFTKGYYKNFAAIDNATRNQYIKTLGNPDMNIYLGCYTYIFKSKGAKSENEVLQRYNASSQKAEYARDICDTVAKARRKYPELKNLNIKS